MDVTKNFGSSPSPSYTQDQFMLSKPIEHDPGHTKDLLYTYSPRHTYVTNNVGYSSPSYTQAVQDMPRIRTIF